LRKIKTKNYETAILIGIIDKESARI